ncbi:hypothetical protein Tco_0235844 [Tanacetum coccineum]
MKLMKETSYELLKDEQKKQLGKNNEAIMTLYNALPHKESKVTAIEEAKDFATLPFDELVGNLKVYEMILENDGVVSKTTTKEKVKSLALKAKVTKEQTSDDNDIQGGSDEDLDEEEAEAFNLMARKFAYGTVVYHTSQTSGQHQSEWSSDFPDCEDSVSQFCLPSTNFTSPQRILGSIKILRGVVQKPGHLADEAGTSEKKDRIHGIISPMVGVSRYFNVKHSPCWSQPITSVNIAGIPIENMLLVG